MIRLAADPQTSETVALKVLAYLAGDDDRLARFLAYTGLTIDEIKARALDRTLLGGVLDYLLEHEGLLIEFARSSGLEPDRLAVLRRDLPGATPAP